MQAPTPATRLICSRPSGSGQISQPAVDLPLGFIALNAVTLLDPADELGAFALDQIEIVVGELAPLLLRFAFYLLPVSFHAIPVHRCLPLAGRRLDDSLSPSRQHTKVGRSRQESGYVQGGRPSTRGGDAAGRSYKLPTKNKFRGRSAAGRRPAAGGTARGRR